MTEARRFTAEDRECLLQWLDAPTQAAENWSEEAAVVTAVAAALSEIHSLREQAAEQAREVERQARVIAGIRKLLKEQARLLADIREWAETPHPLAHTYSSENADHYRGFDAGMFRAKEAVAAMLGTVGVRDRPGQAGRMRPTI